MATRLYLPDSSSAPAISPAVDAAWDVVDASFDRIIAVTVKSSTAVTVRSFSTQSVYASPPNFGVRRQFIYGPIGAQTFGGNVKGQSYRSESGTDADAMRAMIIRVVAPDGTTFRGTVLSDLPGSLASEYTGTAQGSSETNRNTPPSTACGAVVAQNGDYLVIEVGHAWFKSSGTDRFLRCFFGDDQATDAPEDETDTNRATRNPWLEFSQDIVQPSSGQVLKILQQHHRFKGGIGK